MPNYVLSPEVERRLPSGGHPCCAKLRHSQHPAVRSVNLDNETSSCCAAGGLVVVIYPCNTMLIDLSEGVRLEFVEDVHSSS